MKSAMHSKCCRLLRSRGRWRPCVIGFIYYLMAVVLVENILIAWNSADRYRALTGIYGYVPNANSIDNNSSPEIAAVKKFGLIGLPSLPESTSSAPNAGAAQVADLAKGDRVLAPTTAKTTSTKTEADDVIHKYDTAQSTNSIEDLERQFYRRQPTIVNPFRHRVRLAPSGLCPNKTRLIALIHSHPKYIDRRAAIRSTWAEAIRTGRWPHKASVGRSNCCGRMQVAFVVGLSVDPGVNDAVQEEFERHQDIVVGDFRDDYQNMTLKSLLDLKLVDERCKGVDYMLKTDDDMIINLPYLIDTLEQETLVKGQSRFIMGPYNVGSKVYRHGKWKLSKEEFPFDYYPPYESGSAYVISGDLIHDLLDTAQYVPQIFIDDVYITGILGRIVGVRHIRHPGFAFWTDKAPTTCDLVTRKVITGTKMKPFLLFDIWNDLKRNMRCLAPAPTQSVHEQNKTSNS